MLSESTGLARAERFKPLAIMVDDAEKHAAAAAPLDAPEASRGWGYLVGGHLDYPRINRDFTAVCFALPPLIGSASSVIFHGGALWCVAAVATGRSALSRERHVLHVTAALWLFVAAYLVSGLINGIMTRGLVQILWLWTFFVFPFSYAIWSISVKRSIATACVGASVVASYGALAMAVFQYAVLDARPEGGAGNAIVFATVTTFSGAIALAGALAASGRRSGLALGAFVASVLAVSLSETRGVWPAIFVNVALLSLVYRARLRPKMTSFAAVSVVGAALIAVAFFFLVVPRMEAAMADIAAASRNNFDSSLGQRLIMWGESIAIWKERPLFGYGAGSVPELLASRILDHYGVTVSYSHAHNAFLNTLVEAGVVGLTGLVGMIILPLWFAVAALRRGVDADERFGVALILVLISTFLTAGMSSIMVGHDILDTVFVMSLVVGLYLACGKPALREGDCPTGP